MIKINFVASPPTTNHNGTGSASSTTATSTATNHPNQQTTPSPLLDNSITSNGATITSVASPPVPSQPSSVVAASINDPSMNGIDQTLTRSFQALKDTMVHTQSSALKAEEIMAEKLRKRGKQIHQPKKEEVEEEDDKSEQVIIVGGTTSAAAAPTSSTTLSASSSSTKPKKPRRTVRFAEDDDEEGDAIEKSDAASITDATPSSSKVSGATSTSDFDAFLASQFGDAVSSVQARTDANNLVASQLASISLNAPSSSSSNDMPPKTVSIDPIALSSFIHHRQPLPQFVVPTLQELCCASLAQLARNHHLESGECEQLPSHFLQACIEDLKQPHHDVTVAPVLPTQTIHLGTGYIDVSPPTLISPSKTSASEFSLKDWQLAPFLQPQLDYFALDDDSTDAIGGGIVGLPDNFTNDITSSTIDRLAQYCIQLRSLNLGGYSHAFTLDQLNAFSILPLHTLILLHSQISGAELEVLTHSFIDLRNLHLSWSSFLLSKSAFDDIVAILSQPNLRGTLESVRLDGAHANPNELLCKCLELLPNLRDLSIDSTTAPAKSMTREQEEEEKRRKRLQAQSDQLLLIDEAGEAESEQMEQLLADNLKLKEIIEQQRKLQQTTNHLSETSAGSSSQGQFPHFTSLSAIASNTLSTETVLMVLQNSPNLRTLIVKGCNLLTNEVIFTMVRCCRFIQTLNIADCQGIEAEALFAIRDATLPPANRTSRYQEQNGAHDLHANQDGDSSSSLDPGSIGVKSLASLLPSSLPPLGSFLCTIDFSWCENLNNAALTSIFDMAYSQQHDLGSSVQFSSYAIGSDEHRLERVILSCLEDIDEGTIAALAKHRELKELDISRCLHLTAKALFDQANISGSQFSNSFASNWNSILKLTLSWTTVKNDDIRTMTQLCPRLQSLNVEGCKHLTDDCIPHLMASTSARYNLAYISFFFVNHVSLKGTIQLLLHSSCYWLSIKDYYGDIHDKHTLVQDIREAN